MAKHPKAVTDRPPFPTRLVIGPYDWTLKSWTPLAASNSGADGLCDKATQTILIAAGLTPQHEAQVVIHEVLHAAYMVGCLRDHPTLSEEAIVATLSMQLSAILRDNPDLRAYIEDAYS